MIDGLIARLRSLRQGVGRHAQVDAEMKEEFRLHIEMRTEDLIRSGLPRAEAVRQARIEFGSTARYRDEGRESRGLSRFDALRVSWLDFKLGFRMLARYPGLTIVGGLAFAFAIATGAAAFELITQVIRPNLGFDESDRIVAIRSWNAAEGHGVPHTLHDFVMWRVELRSMTDIGAYRTVDRNLIIDDDRSAPVTLAEISASAFRVTRVPPLLGRALVEEDESPGAPPVMVIGQDLWRTRFAGDPDIVGRRVRLGGEQITVVGVMPAGYAFPIFHSVWVPLRLDALDYKREDSPPLPGIFGRLAPGATRDEAQAEIGAIGARMAAEFPQTHQHLRPDVVPYARSVFDISGWQSVGVMSGNLVIVMFLVLVWGNVALLMFARAATRESEIIVRNALGASRARIIMQLFAEALVLGGVAAVVGLGAVEIGLGGLMSAIAGVDGQFPFWLHASLSPTTLVYAALLTLFGAAIAGVVPALKVTSGGVESRLRQAAVGRPGLQFGGVWTAIIVAQVAITVAFPVHAYFVQRDGAHWGALSIGIPREQYLSARLEMDREMMPGGAGAGSRAELLERSRATYRELETRVSTDARVVGVSFADVLPGMIHPRRYMEAEVTRASPDSMMRTGVNVASVAPNLFATIDVPVITGRGFHPTDPEMGRSFVIVNQSFVAQVLGGRNPIGQRVRYVRERADDERNPWYEIIGVVRDLDMSMEGPTGLRVSPSLYHPLAPSAASPVYMAVHTRQDPASFAPRLRAVAMTVDPSLRLYDLLPLNEVNQGAQRWLTWLFRITAAAGGAALLLSLAGIYSVMSFTVARRTREIGIRVALGADHRRIVTAIFRRPLAQVAAGVVAGGILAFMLASGEFGDTPSAGPVALLALYALVMMGVCLLACIVPTRRALSVEPTEALRVDG
jgi:predicted permease